MSATGTALGKEETTFYSDDGGVRVTSARLIIGSTTYAMLNITSVMRAVEPPKRIGPLLFLIGGLFIFGGGLSGSDLSAVVWGVLLLGIGVFWWWKQKPQYHLRIASASGEANAVTSPDKDRVDKIVQAVNEAIIGRG